MPTPGVKWKDGKWTSDYLIPGVKCLLKAKANWHAKQKEIQA